MQMKPQLEPRDIRIVRDLVIVVGAAALTMGGCMRMETQRTTLEHRSQVVAPEGDAVADAPTEPRESR